MTQDERDVLDAALAAVDVETRGNLVIGDISKDAKSVGELVRAVMKLKSRKQDYWRQT